MSLLSTRAPSFIRRCTLSGSQQPSSSRMCMYVSQTEDRTSDSLPQLSAGKHYRMVGNFREVFIFVFFASQEPFVKIITVKILSPMCKANELRFNPWPTSIQ